MQKQTRPDEEGRPDVTVVEQLAPKKVCVNEIMNEAL